MTTALFYEADVFHCNQQKQTAAAQGKLAKQNTSTGVKSLAKASTKGMNKLESFFKKK
jgi:hypothetical protein